MPAEKTRSHTPQNRSTANTNRSKGTSRSTVARNTTSRGSTRATTSSQRKSPARQTARANGAKRPAPSARANAEKRRKFEKRLRHTEWVEAFFEAGIIAIVLFFFFWPTQISGASMQQTFNTGDRAIMSRVMVYLKWLHRNDIVVCKATEQTNNKDIIKRIIGIPGDRIAIIDGQVLINDVVSYEPYAVGVTTGNVDIVLEKNEYFIMGDNREVSYDSRQMGPIPKSNIVGKVVFRYYPLNKLKFY